jgi:hypothetical protein
LELFCFVTSAVFVKCRGPQQDGQNEMIDMLKTYIFAVFVLTATSPAQADIWCLREHGSSSGGACVFPSAQDCSMAARMNAFGGVCERQPLGSQDRRDQQQDRRTTRRQGGGDR